MAEAAVVAIPEAAPAPAPPAPPAPAPPFGAMGVDDPPDEVVERFEVLNQVGVGAFGTVCEARCRATGDRVALKTMLLDEMDGVPATSLREVTALKALTQANIVRLLEVLCGGAALVLVFEFLEQDLRSYIKQEWPISPNRIQHLCFQLLIGIGFMHQQRFLHRDLKPHNVLLAKDMTLKIADFGFARVFGLPQKMFTREVVTLWYRSPEILLGAQVYAASVDMWSCGCILGELATGRALFPGDSEIGTILKIFELCGTPTDATWPKFSSLPFAQGYDGALKRFPKWTDHLGVILQRAPQLTQEGSALLRELLVPCPDQRLSARRAAHHGFFRALNTAEYDAGHFFPA